MNYYFAPMEGLTNFIYRRAHFRYFPGIDKYFSPFIVTNEKVSKRHKEIKDILPENNDLNARLIPQILSKDASEFITYARFLSSLGYKELNLNVGCPSMTVFSKGRGSGLLKDLAFLENFLNDIFSADIDAKISIKTRVGVSDSSSFERILEIYNKFPVCELIVHPRCRNNFYKPDTLDMDAFNLAYSSSCACICYNGDLYTPDDISAHIDKYPQLENVMIGRGLITRPWLVSKLKDYPAASNDTLLAFHDEIFEGYIKNCANTKLALWKMKEFWTYLSSGIETPFDHRSKILKCQSLEEYTECAQHIISIASIK